MLPPAVKTVSKDEKDRALDVFLLAFVDDPMLRWIFADASLYLKHSASAHFGLGGRSVAQGTAHVLDDYSAASFWLPPGVGPDEEALGTLIERVVPADKQADLGAVVEQMGQYHPHEPHWYLAVLGVDASRQGRGLGSVIMKHALARVDAEHLPAYLESSNPRNIPFYERHGFEVIGRIQAGATPAVTPMLRRAR